MIAVAPTSIDYLVSLANYRQVDDGIGPTLNRIGGAVKYYRCVIYKIFNLYELSRNRVQPEQSVTCREAYDVPFWGISLILY